MAAVEIETRDRVVHATLNRPDALNGITPEVMDGLEAAMAAVKTDPTAKALVIAGAGRAFSVGLDIDLLKEAFSDLTVFEATVRRLKRVLCDLEALEVPVVAAVNGLARAGGFELMLACDLVLVAADARVGDTHLSFGIVPGGGASQRLPRRIGHQRAREVILTGRWLTGTEAADIGLALRAVPGDQLAKEVDVLVDHFRPLSRPCLSATKAAMVEGQDLPLAHALDVELTHFLRFLAEVPDADEGYRAYVEDRPPVWS